MTAKELKDILVVVPDDDVVDVTVQTAECLTGTFAIQGILAGLVKNEHGDFYWALLATEHRASA